MLSRRITELRNQKQITQSQLAKILHVSASTVGMYEQGRRTPSIDMLVELSKAFGISLDYLITGTDYLYTESTSQMTQISKDCPCSTCYWKHSIK